MTIEEFKKLYGKTVTYENITDYIDRVFPEFTQWDEYKYYGDEKDLKYVYVGGLASLAFEGLDEREDIGLAKRLVEFTNHVINEFGESKNKETSDDLGNLFGIEIYEPLTGYRKGAHLAKQYLSGEALQSFHNTTKGYNTEEFLNEYFKIFEIHPITATDPESLYSYMWNDLQRPKMNPPEQDQQLSDIRTNLELDEILIAGTLSYVTKQKVPPEVQMKNFYKLRNAFRSYREQLSKHKSSDNNELYKAELLSFIDDLERISTNTGIWMFNNGIK